MEAPEIRPRTVADVIDAVFKIYLDNFVPLITIVAVVTGPILVLQGLLQLGVFNDIAAVDIANAESIGDLISGSQIAAGVVLGLLGWAASALAAGAVVKAVADIHLGRPVDWQDSIRFALPHLGPLLIGSLLFGLGVATGIVFFIVPGVFLAVSWAVFSPAVVIERMSGAAALGRSWNLMAGRRWPVFGAFIVMVIITSIVSSVLGRALGGSADFTFVDVIVGAAVGVLTTPLLGVTVVVVYFELRARKSGYDAMRLAAEVDASPAGPDSIIR